MSTTLGGRGGGTAALTPFGLEIIRRYRAMEAAAERAIARDAAALARHVRSVTPPLKHRPLTPKPLSPERGRRC